tara:strand:- start:15370 stop:16395 length:1026 start_codon:yes stop_codon:yes gene_type:complete
MALPTSGPLTLDQIHIEAGGSSGTLCSLNDADIRGIINKSVNASNAFSDYRGQSAETSLPTGGSQINGQVQLKEITASSYISSGGTLRIPSTMWVWSDSTSTAALTIDIPCTIINDGKIIGKGGNGSSYYAYTTGATAGGPAINVTSSGVTITNSSGAYIAGGGGGGGHAQDGGDPQDANSGGGGGAGGGQGGRGHISSHSGENAGTLSGLGGALNASGGGTYHRQTNSLQSNNGGGAGGAGGGAYYSRLAGGGGGRILPGVGGTVFSSPNQAIGAGGSGGNVGGTHGAAGTGALSVAAGGGGGWGAAGGNGISRVGAAGGAAIQGTSRTLNNSGTIYGST